MALTKIDDRGVTYPLDLLDNEKIRFGTGNDLEVFHDGNFSRIKDVGTGDLVLQSNTISFVNAADNAVIAQFKESGSVDLYYNGSKKLETQSDGVLVTGKLNPTGHLYINDSQKARFGTSQDLEIFHDSNNSVIQNSTGQLYIKSPGGLNIDSLSEQYIHCTENAGVQLYYDDSNKLATTSTGANIYGRMNMQVDDSSTYPTASWGTKAYTAYDHELVIDNNTQDNEGSFAGIYFNAGADAGGGKVGTARISAVDTGNHSADLVFATRNVGFSEKLRITAAGNIQIPNDSGRLQLGASQDLILYHDGSHSYIVNSSGILSLRGASAGIVMQSGSGEDMLLAVPDGAVKLYFDNSKKLETTSTGVTLSGQLTIPSKSSSYEGITLATPSGDATGEFHIGVHQSGTSSGRAIVFKRGGSSGFATESMRITGAGNLQIANDSGKLQLGASQDLALYHDGSQSWLDNSTGNFFIRHGNDIAFKVEPNAKVQLFYDGNLKLETLSTGINVYGGIRLGGDNAANECDDYEEGQYNPTITCFNETGGAISGGYNLSSSSDTLAYTKIGRVVHIQGYLAIGSESSPDGTLRFSLPFASASLTEDSDHTAFKVFVRDHGVSYTHNQVGVVTGGNSYFQILFNNDSGTDIYFNHGHVDTAWSIFISGTYLTA